MISGAHVVGELSLQTSVPTGHSGSLSILFTTICIESSVFFFYLCLKSLCSVNPIIWHRCEMAAVVPGVVITYPVLTG